MDAGGTWISPKAACPSARRPLGHDTSLNDGDKDAGQAEHGQRVSANRGEHLGDIQGVREDNAVVPGHLGDLHAQPRGNSFVGVPSTELAQREGVSQPE